MNHKAPQGYLRIASTFESWSHLVQSCLILEQVEGLVHSALDAHSLPLLHMHATAKGKEREGCSEVEED